MSKQQHIENFRIRNFKRFDELTVSGLGQINLIVGDNNVGKTSLLEALLVDEDAITFLKRLHKTLCFRNIHIHAMSQTTPQGVSLAVPTTNYLALLLADISKPFAAELKTRANEQKEISLQSLPLAELLKQPGSEKLVRDFIGVSPDTVMVSFKVGAKKSDMPLFLDDLSEVHNFHIPFIPASKMYNADLAGGFQAILAPSRTVRQRFIKNLSIILPGVREVLPWHIHDKEHLAVVVEGSDASHPLGRFGDGTIKCARVFMEMARCQNGRLMVDEVDAGIHHSRMDSYWKSIIQASLDNNIQLIAATHSLECLQSFKRVFEAGELVKSQSEVRCIALSELADHKTVKAYTYPWNEFEAAIKHDNELR